MSCSKKGNEFNEGDQYIEDGIIYTYYDLDIERPFKKRKQMKTFIMNIIMICLI
ncbi:MAG: hypothetical protein L6U99_00590 [Clostridium sp.]|nr:MAG: hypothetical protein L6U99_00590 [Clostridium sp.]